MATLKQKLEQAAIELANTKYQLSEAQKNFDELYRQATGSKREGKSTSKPTPKPESSEGIAQPIGRLIDRLETLLIEDPKHTFHYESAAKKLGTTPNTVRAMLYKLGKDGKVARVGRGMWKWVALESRKDVSV